MSMNRIRASIESTLSQYPWIEKEELIKLYLKFIEENYIGIFEKAVDRTTLPSKASQRREVLRERRKSSASRRSPDELRKWKIFMDWLEHIKSGGDEENGSDNDCSSVKWRRSSNDHTAKLSQQEQEALKKVMDVNSSRLVSSPIMSDLEIEMQKYREENDSSALESPMVSEEIDGIKEFEDVSDEEMNIISSIAREIAGGKILEIKKHYNDDFGYIIEITLDQNDKDAFDTWFSILDRIETLEMDSKVIVNWTQKNILDDNKLTQKMIDAMLRLDIAPKRNDRFNAAKEAYEGGF